MSAPAQSADLLLATSKPPDAIPAATPPPKHGRIYTAFPKIWIGMVLAGLCLACEIADVLARGSKSHVYGHDGIEGLVVLISWAGSCYWLFCVWRVHRILSEYTLKAYSISPRKAVGFQIVPLFQFYWSFHWTKLLTQFIDGRKGKNTKGSVWPGLLLIVTSVLGYYPFFKPVRLFFLFSLAFYLNNRLRKVLPECQPLRLPFKRAEQWNLALSAGVGAICTFLVVEAILDLFDKDAKPGQELLTVVLVSAGMLLFLEPVFDRLRGLFGLGDPTHAHPNKPLIRFATLAILLFTNLFHGMLDSTINRAMSGDRGSVVDSLTSVLTFLFVSGGMTYSWIAAAHRVPSRAARNGLMFGLFATLMLGILLPDSSMLGTGIVSKAFGETPPQVTFTNLSRGAAHFVTSELDSELQALGTMRFAWPLFGLFGGLAIDRKWGKRRPHIVALIIVGTCVLYELLRFIPRWPGLHPTEELAHEIVSHFSAALGWGLALIVCSSPRILAPVGTTESDAPELRGKPRRAGPPLPQFRRKPAAPAAVPQKA